MGPLPPSRSLRLVNGEIESRLVSTRLLIPSSGQAEWPPFRRVAESLASRGRQLPTHAHEREEVLTYVVEGFASYQLEGGAAEPLPQGSARLLTAPARASHRIAPVEGGVIRWFSLVLRLPPKVSGSSRLQSTGPGRPFREVDNVRVLPLVGPGAPMTSESGLECQEMVYVRDSTTFLRVGGSKRAVIYASAGEGSVDERTIAPGVAALAEGLPGVALRGGPGFRAIVAMAPSGPAEVRV